MSQNKVVSIKAHPRYRDIAALRKFLVEGQEDSGTKVDMDRFIVSDNPEVQRQLLELNAWCESLKDMPEGLPPVPTVAELTKAAEAQRQVDFSHYRLQTGSSEGKSRPICEIIPSFLSPYFTSGLKKGDFYNHAAVPPMPWDSPTPLHHMSRNANHITLDNRYMVKEPDDANPST